MHLQNFKFPKDIKSQQFYGLESSSFYPYIRIIFLFQLISNISSLIHLFFLLLFAWHKKNFSLFLSNLIKSSIFCAYFLSSICNNDFLLFPISSLFQIILSCPKEEENVSHHILRRFYFFTLKPSLFPNK